MIKNLEVQKKFEVEKTCRRKKISGVEVKEYLWKT